MNGAPLATDPVSVAMFLGFVESAANATVGEARDQWFELADIALSGGFAEIFGEGDSA